VTLRGDHVSQQRLYAALCDRRHLVSDAKVPRGINRLTQRTVPNAVSSDEEQR